MNRKIRGWRISLLGGTVLFIVFLWTTEYIDLPHILLGAPATPANLAEVMLEGSVAIAGGAIFWRLFSYYESGWMEALQEQQRLATIDDLTGAYNRRYCLAKAAEEFQRSRRFRHGLSLVMLDLDDFKSINDNFGHLAGDRALIEFTRLVKGQIRAQDCLGRVGGDEFMILFIETEPAEALRVIERIRAQWDQGETARMMGALHRVTLSVGIAAPHSSDETITDCIRRCDQALYHAKANGRNRVELA
jgi:diguanylate cyclase (GGDEF)-like protein